MSMMFQKKGSQLNTLYFGRFVFPDGPLFLCFIDEWGDVLKDIFSDMQAKIGCMYISDLPYHKRRVWHEMKRISFDDYGRKQIEDFSIYVFGVSWRILQMVMEQIKE